GACIRRPLALPPKEGAARGMRCAKCLSFRRFDAILCVWGCIRNLLACAPRTGLWCLVVSDTPTSCSRYLSPSEALADVCAAPAQVARATLFSSIGGAQWL